LIHLTVKASPGQRTAIVQNGTKSKQFFQFVLPGGELAQSFDDAVLSATP